MPHIPPIPNLCQKLAVATAAQRVGHTALRMGYGPGTAAAAAVTAILLGVFLATR